ncbi:hypothetical protein BDV26DRAFT_292031 [Aspergillus bertholletiae]|uniref:DUF7703 domain-containing protein n=1 Tax=Aspergillus bertholletiae TaxID=1226010 RepID=A0A5N7BA51_9EURO|nr:hypothetical protein BDV26DRAFT_292031 [Aspergillus bertholletiae]
MPAVTEPPVLDRETSQVAIPLLAVAAYNCVELLYWIFSFFRRYQGCYFWSLLVTTLGMVIFITGVALSLAEVGPDAVGIIAYPFGFLIMGTASAMVLYARLHLVTTDRTPQYVLFFIIFTTCTLYIPISVIYLIGAFTGFATRPDLASFAEKFEHFVIACSCARELLLSGGYLWVASRNLKPVLDMKGRQGRRVIRELIFVNLFVLSTMVCLLVIDNTNHSSVKKGFGVLVTSIKMKLEFAVLNRLVTLVQSPLHLNHVSSLHHSAEHCSCQASDPDHPLDTDRYRRPTHNISSHHAATVARAIPSPPQTLSSDRLMHRSPEHSIAELSSSQGTI